MSTQATEHLPVIRQLKRILNIYTASEGSVRPHFMLTGASGSGKSYSIQTLCEEHDLGYLEVNAAQLTKEGTSGNSLSKALSPLANRPGLTLCFVDEFDKLFISGNGNSQLAHEVTNGVQNEFLKVLESTHTSVYGDYGKYVDVDVSRVLFVFAGAFNGEENISLDRLRDFGIKTEFLGRVGLIYSMEILGIESLEKILVSSELLAHYLTLFPQANQESAISTIMGAVVDNYPKNTLGVRLLNNLLHTYFINDGSLPKKEAERHSFQKTLQFTEGS